MAAPQDWAAVLDDDALVVAHRLLGAQIELKGPLSAAPAAGRRFRLAELEAYCFPNDTANHARFGRTARNAPMWGPPGFVYIYLCYGVHLMLNFVTGPAGQAAAVLVRGVEPLDDAGRPAPSPRLNGPGKVGRAFGLARTHTGWAAEHLFSLRLAETPTERRVGPRIGIGYATPADQAAPWRVALPGSPHVGHPRGLGPPPPAPVPDPPPGGPLPAPDDQPGSPSSG